MESEAHVLWPVVVLLVVFRAYVTAAASVMSGCGLLPRGYVGYVFLAEFAGSWFHTKYADNAKLIKLRKRVKTLERRLPVDADGGGVDN